MKNLKFFSQDTKDEIYMNGLKSARQYVFGMCMQITERMIKHEIGQSLPGHPQ